MIKNCQRKQKKITEPYTIIKDSENYVARIRKKTVVTNQLNGKNGKNSKIFN